jgi:hypothetical protein
VDKDSEFEIACGSDFPIEPQQIKLKCDADEEIKV